MKHKKEVTKKLQFPIEGKIRFENKEEYSLVLDKLYSLGYQFESGKKLDISNNLPLGISWELLIDLEKKPIIRKTYSNRVFINYSTNYIDLSKVEL